MAHPAGGRRLSLQGRQPYAGEPDPGGPVTPDALNARLIQALETLSDGYEVDEQELASLLDVQLQRHSQAVAGGRRDLGAFASIRREQRVMSRALDRLRGRLALLRGAARQSQVR
jgi:hypothetical protein